MSGGVGWGGGEAYNCGFKFVRNRAAHADTDARHSVREVSGRGGHDGFWGGAVCGIDCSGTTCETTQHSYRKKRASCPQLGVSHRHIDMYSSPLRPRAVHHNCDKTQLVQHLKATPFFVTMFFPPLANPVPSQDISISPGRIFSLSSLPSLSFLSFFTGGRSVTSAWQT